jgi:hypothetical protein
MLQHEGVIILKARVSYGRSQISGWAVVDAARRRPCRAPDDGDRGLSIGIAELHHGAADEADVMRVRADVFDQGRAASDPKPNQEQANTVDCHSSCKAESDFHRRLAVKPPSLSASGIIAGCGNIGQSFLKFVAFSPRKTYF